MQIDSRGISGCVVDGDGTVSCWEVDRPTPTPVMTLDGKPLDGVISIARTSMARCALRQDGSVWCWGEGVLGDPESTFSPQATPVRSDGLDGPLGNVTHLSSSALSVLAVIARGNKLLGTTAKAPKEETAEVLNLRFLALVQSGNFKEAAELAKKLPEVQVKKPAAQNASPSSAGPGEALPGVFPDAQASIPGAQNALTSAARAGEVKIAKMLVDAYRKSGTQDGNSTVSLQEITCDCIPGLRPAPEMVAMLLASGADVLARDSDGRNPLTWVMRRSS